MIELDRAPLSLGTGLTTRRSRLRRPSSCSSAGGLCCSVVLSTWRERRAVGVSAACGLRAAFWCGQTTHAARNPARVPRPDESQAQVRHGHGRQAGAVEPDPGRGPAPALAEGSPRRAGPPGNVAGPAPHAGPLGGLTARRRVPSRRAPARGPVAAFDADTSPDDTAGPHGVEPDPAAGTGGVRGARARRPHGHRTAVRPRHIVERPQDVPTAGSASGSPIPPSAPCCGRRRSSWLCTRRCCAAPASSPTHTRSRRGPGR